MRRRLPDRAMDPRIAANSMLFVTPFLPRATAGRITGPVSLGQPGAEFNALTLSLSRSTGEGTLSEHFRLDSPLACEAGESGGEGRASRLSRPSGDCRAIRARAAA